MQCTLKHGATDGLAYVFPSSELASNKIEALDAQL
jgi:hypothetical protein